MFHFTKDESAFCRFALELLAADPKLIELKKIGFDMETAIYRGFKNSIFKLPIGADTKYGRELTEAAEII